MPAELPSDAAPERRKSSKSPLYLRMYQQRHLVDFVRAVGYGHHAQAELRTRLQPLLDAYGPSLLRAAADELLTADESRTPPVFRLTDECRRLAVQLLGRPPESGSLVNGTTPQASSDTAVKPTPSTDRQPQTEADSPAATESSTPKSGQRRSRRAPRT